MTRILIADDHEVVRSGLRAILERHEGWEVVAEAQDGKEAIVKAIESKPDVAIIDYSLPLINGIEAARQIRGRVPNAEILIFTMHDSDVLIGFASCAPYPTCCIHRFWMRPRLRQRCAAMSTGTSNVAVLLSISTSGQISVAWHRILNRVVQDCSGGPD